MRAEQALYEALFYAVGALVGRRFTRALREMEKAQWLSPESLRQRSEVRLAPLLRHAAENVPFYGDQYRRHGLAPDSLRTLDDLVRLPIVGKATHRQHPPDHFLAANVPPHRRLPDRTSGSTGEPFQFYLDRESMPVLVASYLFHDSWFGLRAFDRSVRVRVPRSLSSAPAEDTPGASRLRQQLTARVREAYKRRTQREIWTWEVDREKARAIYEQIQAFQPDYILGYTSALATVADELLRQDRRMSRRPRAVIVGADTLTPARRHLLEEYFGAPIINRYGLREIGSHSAQSCPDAPEQFHVNSELVHWETVREDGTPASAGEIGRVVLTSLHNYAMPFIRYDTGDLAVVGERQCVCGRGFPVVESIEGRSVECIRTPSGTVISPVVLGHYLREGGPLFQHRDHLEGVHHYQLVHDATDRVRLKIVPAPAFSAERRHRLQSDLARLLGEKMTVVVETVPEIPCDPSGKRPIIKQLAVLPPEEAQVGGEHP